MELWVQFKALPCISCTKKCKLMHSTGASGSYRENDTVLLPHHPSVLLYILQVLRCKVYFLSCLNFCRSSPLCPLISPVPEHRKVTWVGGKNFLSCFSFLLFHIATSVIRLWKPHYVLLIISCQLINSSIAIVWSCNQKQLIARADEATQLGSPSRSCVGWYRPCGNTPAPVSVHSPASDGMFLPRQQLLWRW